MGKTDEIPRTYEDAIITLARWHADEGERPIDIYSLDDPQKETVQLVEVSDEFGVSDAFATSNRLLAIPMGRSTDFPYKSAVILVARSEWDDVENGKKTLPEGWDRSKLRQVWPANHNGT